MWSNSRFRFYVMAYTSQCVTFNNNNNNNNNNNTIIIISISIIIIIALEAVISFFGGGWTLLIDAAYVKCVGFSISMSLYRRVCK